jgi:hypothetical protein
MGLWQDITRFPEVLPQIFEKTLRHPKTSSQLADRHPLCKVNINNLFSEIK